MDGKISSSNNRTDVFKGSFCSTDHEDSNDAKRFVQKPLPALEKKIQSPI
jgi:hypothetical protein